MPLSTRRLAIILTGIGVNRPSTASCDTFHVSNAVPRQPNLFVQLPIGSLKLEGYRREHLNRHVDGLARYLSQIGVWLTKNHNAWIGSVGKPKLGSEIAYRSQ